MTTKIVTKKDWETLNEYDSFFTMNKGDVIEIESSSYVVNRNFLDLNNDTMIIIVEKLN